MELSIRAVSNGYIVKTLHLGQDPQMEEEIFTESIEDFQSLLYAITEYFGQRGSRYDEKRLYIKIEPGDKHESNTISKL